MNIVVTHGDALNQETPLLVFGTWKGAALPEQLANLLEAGDWTGNTKQTLLLYTRGAIPARRVLLLGLGEQDDAHADRLRECAAVAAQRAREAKVERYTLAVPPLGSITARAAGQALAEGSLLALYRYQKYKTGLKDEDTREIEQLTIVTSEADQAFTTGVTTGEAVAHGVMLARDLANAPGNELTPTVMGETARQIGREFGMQVTVLGPSELREQGFGGILAVAQGSQQEPRFIIIEYGAEYANGPTICLVGKGITFDSGGISIKPAAGMEDMKMDMGGAAAVLGALQAVGELKLPLHVVGLISSAENMPSASAFKPGDIVKTLSGKTIEVVNTDAEGRVVLSDALHYAGRFKPAAVIDLATLTGAIMVALGPHATGMMSNDDDLSARLERAGQASGERVWRLPLWDPYKDMVKSDIADVKNSAGRPGGAITAAAFLSAFVDGYPWAHLDIAGTAWVDRQTKAYTPKGATGGAVRLLIETLQSWL
jgi:leucyl aminopeptidase